MGKDFSRQPNERAPAETHREAAYLRYLAHTQTPVVVKLISGEVVKGFIEYYDRRFIRVTRQGEPNLFIFKSKIKYLYEEQPAELPQGELAPGELAEGELAEDELAEDELAEDEPSAEA
jgi:host factor-I protein